MQGFLAQGQADTRGQGVRSHSNAKQILKEDLKLLVFERAPEEETMADCPALGIVPKIMGPFWI